MSIYIDLDLTLDDVYAWLDPETRPPYKEFKEYEIKSLHASEYKWHHGVHIEMTFIDKGVLKFFQGDSECCKLGCCPMQWDITLKDTEQ